MNKQIFSLVIFGLAACQTTSETPTQSLPSPISSPASPSSSSPRQTPTPSVSSSPVAPPVTGILPAAPEAVAFDLAIERAATALFSAAERDPELASRLPQSVMIDPLVDGNTAQQTVSSAAMGLKIANVMGTKFNRFQLVAFRESSRSKNPLLLVGTITAINAANAPQARNDLYRICLALVDVNQGKVVAKGVGRATEKTVDATPLAFYGDSPALVKDKVTDGYVRTCQGTRPGDAADANYLAALPTAMLLDEAANAYQASNYAVAKKLYQTAASMPEGTQKRVVTGLYLTSWKLRQTKDAEAAFITLVSRAMEEKRLGMKFLFQPGSVNFVANNDLRAQYALWTKVIGTSAARQKNCLNVVGHTSRSGTEPANEALSTKRAETMVKALERNSSLRNRLTPQGVGSREAIVGSGTDDVRDAIDRRVDFRVVDCAM